MNYNPSTIARIADIHYGLRVDTAVIPAATLSTANPTRTILFNLVGGRALIRQLVGEVTVALTGGAALMKFYFTPTGGAQVDLTAVSLTVENLAAGQRLVLGAAIGGSTTFSGIGVGVAKVTDPYILGMCQAGVGGGPGGAIGLHATTAGLTGGSMKFSVWYVPLDDGVYIEAA
jgi:hypothetical protein